MFQLHPVAVLEVKRGGLDADFFSVEIEAHSLHGDD